MSDPHRHNEKAHARTQSAAEPSFPEIPVSPEVEGALARARARASAHANAADPGEATPGGDGARSRGEVDQPTAAWTPDFDAEDDPDRPTSALWAERDTETARARRARAAAAAQAEAGAQDGAEDDQPVWNAERQRWEHPATGLVWDEEGQDWVDPDEDPTEDPLVVRSEVEGPPPWTPPSIALAAQPPRRRKPKIKKLRVLMVLTGLGLLAGVSTVFGMMMAVASDLPQLESRPIQHNSMIKDFRGRPLGRLVGNEARIIVREDEIAPAMKHAIIAIEDRRFYTNPGVDIKGIARALYQDIVQQRVVQGGSTITQQFVKQASEAQNDRTLFQKLREAAMAYHLTRKWSKEKILKEYLNEIYFGNGAYGIESAARVYFGWNHPQCMVQRPERKCSSLLEPQEAALIAGVVASPSLYDPIANPINAKKRRDLVLKRMLEQKYIGAVEYRKFIEEPLPTRDEIRPPREESDYPYFVSWVRQQVVDQMGAKAAFGGGLVVQTTLDIDLQKKAEAAIPPELKQPGGPTASMVVIDNATGEVRAMVGGLSGPDKEARLQAFAERPFNLATQGQRQPGSAFKPFILAAALRAGISPDSTWESRKLQFDVPGTKGKEKFTVNNYEDAYAGTTTLRRALTFSDNAVYAKVGIKVGTKRVARLARQMGIRTSVSTNYAMTLGGLEEGVTPLDMAHAYQTFARRGKLTYGRLSPDTRDAVPGPAGIHEIRRCTKFTRFGTCVKNETKIARLPNGKPAVNRTQYRRVLTEYQADTASSIMATVIKQGTAKRADLGKEFAAGKTGTTENYGDAWFVGYTRQYTVAVWVGYPDKVIPMKAPNLTFGGEPVAGGTYPAAIWGALMRGILKAENDKKLKRAQAKARREGKPIPQTLAEIGESGPTGAAGASPSAAGGAATGAGAGGAGYGDGGTGGGATQSGSGTTGAGATGTGGAGGGGGGATGTGGTGGTGGGTDTGGTGGGTDTGAGETDPGAGETDTGTGGTGTGGTDDTGAAEPEAPATDGTGGGAAPGGDTGATAPTP